MQKFWLFWRDHIRITILLIFFITVAGIIAAITLPKESNPEVNIPVIVVTTTLPGGSPDDVESLVTNEIEDELDNLNEVVNFTSTSRNSVSSIVLEFETSADADEKEREVQSAVNRAESDLPADANSPLVNQVSFTDLPFLQIALSGPYNTTALEPIADSIAAELEQINGVDEVAVEGATITEYRVSVDQQALLANQLNITQVVSAINAANLSIPAGSATIDSKVISIEVNTNLSSDEDLSEVIVPTSTGTAVQLSDIATIQELPRPQTVSSRFWQPSFDDRDPAPSVFLQVRKVQGEGSIINLSEQVLELLKTSQANGTFPADLEFTVIQNDAELIQSDLQNLIGSGILTVLIIFAILFLFLSVREALLAATVIPLSYVTTLFVLSLLDSTINFLSLFGLLLALGILVDASIVVTESLYQNIKSGLSPYEAGTNTIKEYATPLIAGTLTTIFVFIPMFFVTGTIGEFLKSIPITVISVLLAALFFSLAIVPAFARFLKPKNTNAAVSNKFLSLINAASSKTKTFSNWLDIKYDSVSKTVFRSAKLRKRIFWLTPLVFLASISLVPLGVIRVELFPGAVHEFFIVNLELPAGTDLETTSQKIRIIESILESDNEIELYSTTIGASTSLQGSGSVGEQFASVRVNFDDSVINGTDRVSEYETVLMNLPKTNPDLSSATIQVETQAGGPPQGSPVEIRLFSDNLSQLDSAANQLADDLRKRDGVINVSSGIVASGGDLEVSIDRGIARSYGITEQQLGLALRSLVSGLDAGSIKTPTDDIDVVVYTENPLTGRQRALSGGSPNITLTELQNTQINTTQGPIPLSAFATLTPSSGRTVIEHRYGDRFVVVSADVTDDTNATQVVSELENTTLNQLDDLVNYEISGESADIAESFTSLGIAMMVGVIAIFGLLVLMFKSFRLSIIILSTVPLSIIGVMLGLAISRLPFSFPGFIGIVGLAGVVVNNAIILIDVINIKVAEANTRSEKIEAVRQASLSRLQPIVLTTITTVAGLSPLVITDPTWAPLAVSIIFGLIFATILTLIVVPILYVRFARQIRNNN